MLGDAMTDEQDVNIALLQQRLERAESELSEVKTITFSLRDDRLRIEGGKWVLWFLGGLVLALTTIWFSLVNSTPIQKLISVHGG